MKKKKFLIIFTIILVISVLSFLIAAKLLTKSYGPGSIPDSFGDASEEIKAKMIKDLKESKDRLTFNKYDIEVRKANNRSNYFAIKNELNNDYDFVIYDPDFRNDLTDEGKWSEGDGSTIDCYDSMDPDISQEEINRHISFKTFRSRTIAAGDVAVQEFVMVPGASAKPTTYSCAMVIQNPENGSLYARKDFFVVVQ